jgi:hypothetical protein
MTASPPPHIVLMLLLILIQLSHKSVSSYVLQHSSIDRHSGGIYPSTIDGHHGLMRETIRRRRNVQETYCNQRQQFAHKSPTFSFSSIERFAELRLHAISNRQQVSESITKTSPQNNNNLKIILDNINTLSHQGSDIRGTFEDIYTIHDVAVHIKEQGGSKVALLTPLTSYCFGYSFVQQQIDHQRNNNNNSLDDATKTLTIVVGHDSRVHGKKLADAFIRGVIHGSPKTHEDELHDNNNDQINNKKSSIKVNVKYAGLVTTPACAAFCRMELADAAVVRNPVRSTNTYFCSIFYLEIVLDILNFYFYIDFISNFCNIVCCLVIDEKLY